MVSIYVYHLDDDDPKKCTAQKMKKFDLANIVTHMEELPRGGILLDPYAEKAISREDREAVMDFGLVAIDCSWENAEEVFRKAVKNRKLSSRALPFLMAVNPVNYGKPFKLTTLEALAGALCIMGWVEDGEKLLNIYNWGKSFIPMNREPLKDYSKAKTSAEVAKAQENFI